MLPLRHKARLRGLFRGVPMHAPFPARDQHPCEGGQRAVLEGGHDLAHLLQP